MRRSLLTSILDYWVGSLDFNFLVEICFRLFPLNPQKVNNFLQGGQEESTPGGMFIELAFFSDQGAYPGQTVDLRRGPWKGETHQSSGKWHALTVFDTAVVVKAVLDPILGFSVNSAPILEPILVGIGMFTGGTGF